jgi:CheY-like chemotaxis protein
MSRILLVDDVRSDVRTILAQNGFEVVFAPDARTGLEAIQGQKFDVIIVDIFMTGMDGLETIRVFRKHAPTVPIIAVSGFMFRDAATPAPDFLSMATKLGAARSLAKPCPPQDLLHAVNGCLPDQHAPQSANEPGGMASSARAAAPSGEPMIAATIAHPANGLSVPPVVPVLDSPLQPASSGADCQGS